MDFLETVIRLSETENGLKELIKEFSRPEVEENLSAANSEQLDELFSALDPRSHTLGCIPLLVARLQRKEGQSTAVGHMLGMLAAFNPTQARLWPCKFTEMCQLFTNTLVETKQPIRGVRPLLMAIYSFRPTPKHITPLHAMVTQLAILSKCYHTVLPLLDEPISEVSVEGTGIDAAAVLLYFYYGGMAYTGMREYTKAQDFFLAAVCVPAQVVSAIALEAFKKYVLVSLLAEGCVPKHPSYAPVLVLRQAKLTCKEYIDFASTYMSHNAVLLERYLQHHAETFMRDNNMGLANQCAEALHCDNIKRLTRTFMTLSLVDIAENTGLRSPEVAEMYILRMVGEGQIHAKISQKDGMVLFLEGTEEHNTSEMLSNIHDEICGTVAVNEKMAEADRAMATMEAYLIKSGGIEAFRKKISD